MTKTGDCATQAHATLLGLLQLPGLRSVVLQHCGAAELALLRLTCRTALAAVRLHCTSASWDDRRHGGAALGADGVFALAHHPRLQRLTLQGDDNSTAALALALAALPDACPALHTLELLPGAARVLPARHAATLARAPLPKLRVLRLPWVDAAGMAELARSSWRALQVLELSVEAFSPCPIGDEGAAALSLADWPALRELKICSNAVGPAGAAALASASFSAMQSLSLDYNCLEDGGAAALARAAWPSLKALSLRGNGITHAGAASLSDACFFALAELDLGGNLLGDDGAAALASAPFSRLTDLDLTDNRVSDAGAVALAAAPWRDSLKVLRLSGNNVRQRGAGAIAAPGAMPRLKRLLLWGNNELGPEGARALSRGDWKNLQVLDLGYTAIGGEGAAALASTAWPALQKCCLGGNALGDEGACELARAARLPALLELDLESNEIGDQGAEALAAVRGWDALRVLRLYNNWAVGEAGMRALTGTGWVDKDGGNDFSRA